MVTCISSSFSNLVRRQNRNKSEVTTRMQTGRNMNKTPAVCAQWEEGGGGGWDLPQGAVGDPGEPGG